MAGHRLLVAVASLVAERRLCMSLTSYSTWLSGSWALERRLSSCGTRASLLCTTWDLPGSGTGPVSPALAGGFFTLSTKEAQLMSVKWW